MGLGNIALEVGQEIQAVSDKIANIIEFVEAPWGLGMDGKESRPKLFPVQRIILKAHYGLALDDVEEFTITNWRRQNPVKYTEASYLKHLFDEGRCNIEEVIPGIERRELILSIGRRSGKCILGDSLVLTDQGIQRIEEMGDPEGPEVQPLVVGVAQEGTDKQARSAYFYNGGVRHTRMLTTHCGYQLGGTDNHRIKVLTEKGEVDWKYLADLRVGDVVCIHRGTNLWASEYVDCTPYHNGLGLKDLTFPDTLTEEWGRLLGYLVGDGLWNYRGRVEVTVEHPETWDTLKALYTKLLGGYSVAMDKRTENTGALKFGSVGMRKFLHDLGFRLGTDRDAKMVPWAILKSPRPVVQAFLRGLFEADGGVESNGKVVSFSTASGRLAREVQTLLLNLGIVSSIRPKPINGRIYWLLAIRGLRSRLAFAERVGFDSHKKMDPLLVGIKAAGREGGNTESIPHQRQWAQKLLKSVPKSNPRSGNGWQRTKLREVLGNTIKPSSKEDLTYSRLVKALSVASDLSADREIISHFEHLQDLDYFFDSVEEIEEGVNPVFDLNVPEGKSFVANGMTNHNTFLAACISAYETYKLLLKGCPQMYYGIPSTNVIQIISVATDKDQAGLLYQEVSGHFGSCGFFGPYTANNTQSYARFQTPADIARFGRFADEPTAKATIKVTFRSCIAKGLRGAGNLVVILDEVAHFTDGGQSSAENVYNAVTPSTSAFTPKDPNNTNEAIGPGEGRIINISSPLGRQGQFYKLFQIALKGGLASKNMLCIQAPTWEVNPTIPAEELEKHYSKDANIFNTEYGAQFLDATLGWIERATDLEICIDPTRRPLERAPARMPHFIGIDLGLVKDGSAVAIGHIDGDHSIVTDLVDQIKAGEGKYADYDRLEFDDVADWILDLSKRFYLVDGMFDMWAGIPFEQALVKRGLTQLHAEHLTAPLNSQIFSNFKDMMWDKRLVLYDWPLSDTGSPKHCPYITELLELQAQYKSKYVVTVQAPNIEGKHDDRSDALVRMVWKASQKLGNSKYMTGTRGGVGGRVITPDAAYRKMRKQATRMGSHPSRQRSRSNPGRVLRRH